MGVKDEAACDAVDRNNEDMAVTIDLQEMLTTVGKCTIEDKPIDVDVGEAESEGDLTSIQHGCQECLFIADTTNATANIKKQTRLFACPEEQCNVVAESDFFDGSRGNSEERVAGGIHVAKCSRDKTWAKIIVHQTFWKRDRFFF